MGLKKISSFFNLILVFTTAIILLLVVKKIIFSPPHTSEKKLEKRYINNIEKINLSGKRVGAEDAPVHIVEFFDYECPFCKQARPAVEAIRKKYAEDVAVTYENDPLPMHSHARRAALAAECARRQGAFMASTTIRCLPASRRWG